MIITANEMKTINNRKRLSETRSVLHKFEGGTITSGELAKRLEMTVDAVRKRLKNQTAEELLKEGRRKAKWKSK